MAPGARAFEEAVARMESRKDPRQALMQKKETPAHLFRNSIRLMSEKTKMQSSVMTPQKESRFKRPVPTL